MGDEGTDGTGEGEGRREESVWVVRLEGEKLVRV